MHDVGPKEDRADPRVSPQGTKYERLGDSESVSKLLQRKQNIPVKRRTGPASESAFR
jgi:hypothetical protein